MSVVQALLRFLRQYSVSIICLSAACVFAIQTAQGSVDTYQFESREQESRYRALITEFRCPTCQNQNLAGSDAPLAQDLKRTTYELLLSGKTDAQIRDYMVTRYGDFISYKPPVNVNTALLWFLPPLFLLMLLLLWVWRHRHIKIQSNDVEAVYEHKDGE